MKANELRFGNYIHDTSYSGLVRMPANVKLIGEVGLFHVQLYDIDSPIACQENPGNYDISLLEPIRLTGEWLLRLDMPECGSTRDLIGSYDVWFERSGNALFLNTETSSRKVDYVHQVQNIYFALKGEELTLTPL